MNLAEIRDLFVKRSGRYDLVTEDGQDNGANFFIQSGSRFLDRRATVNKAQLGTAIYNVGRDGLVRLPDCWLVQEVHIGRANMWEWRALTQISSRSSPQGVFANSGTPTYYVLKTTRYAPAISRLPASMVSAPSSAFDHQDMASNSLLLEVVPHPTEPSTIEVRGGFYSPSLTADEDTNVWSDIFPDTLIKAALYQLEVFYRNTEGANDWLVSIQLDLTDAEQLEVLADIDDKGVMGL